MTATPVFETSYEQAGVIKPGLPILPPGTERHPVPGGEPRAVPIFKGDAISVLDRDGLQMGELVLFGPDGRSDTAMLGASSAGRPEGVISVLANGPPSGGKVAKALDAAGFDLGRAQGERTGGADFRRGLSPR